MRRFSDHEQRCSCKADSCWSLPVWYTCIYSFITIMLYLVNIVQILFERKKKHWLKSGQGEYVVYNVSISWFLYWQGISFRQKFPACTSTSGKVQVCLHYSNTFSSKVSHCCFGRGGGRKGLIFRAWTGDVMYLVDQNGRIIIVNYFLI